MQHKPELDKDAEDFAVLHHRAIGQMYGNQPYEAHLTEVEAAVCYYVPNSWSRAQCRLARAGAWVHDLIEDCRVTYADVAKVLGEEVAELSYVLATPKGRNRAERHCDAYYQEIAKNQIATLVKIADRIANVEASTRGGNEKSQSMLERYRGEAAHFAKHLRPAWPELEPMWKYLDQLLATGE